jgi:hypothetical protein
LVGLVGAQHTQISCWDATGVDMNMFLFLVHVWKTAAVFSFPLELSCVKFIQGALHIGMVLLLPNLWKTKVNFVLLWAQLTEC